MCAQVKSIKVFVKNVYRCVPIKFDDRKDDNMADEKKPKRKSNGKWYHKPGASPIQSIAQKEVFSKVWRNRSGTTYTSDIVLFAFKKGE